MKKDFEGTSMVAFGLGIFLTLIFISMAFSSDKKVKVYLENRCHKDITIPVEIPDGATAVTVDDQTTKAETFEEGTRIYNSKGNLIHTVTSKSEEMTITICD